MYWRVRKITPEMMFKQYGLVAVLAVSLFLNFLLIATRPKKEKMDQALSADFKVFAREVTTHLLDTSYITYLDSNEKLHSELIPEVVRKLKASGLLPKTKQESQAINLELQKSRQVCSLRFDRISVGQPDPKQNNLVPVEVEGIIVIHSSNETSPSQPQPFNLEYWMGISPKTNRPIVGNFREKPTS